MQKPTQEGHDNLLDGVYRGCSLFAGGFGRNGLDRKLTAVGNLFGLLLAIGYLHHR